MKYTILFIALIAFFSQSAALSCNIDNPEVKIIENEGVCPCPYIDTEKIKSIGIDYNISTDAAQQKVKDILKLSNEDLSKILSGNQSLTLQQSKTLFDESMKITKDGLQQMFSSFEKYNANIQYVLMDLAFNIGLDNIQTLTKFQEALEKQNYQEASQELISSQFCNQNKNRCTQNADILSQCSGSSPNISPILFKNSIRFLAQTTNLQKMTQCFANSNQCTSDATCLQDISCLEKMISTRNYEKYIPCFYSCVKDYSLFQFVMDTDPNKMIPNKSECLEAYQNLEVDIQNSPELKKFQEAIMNAQYDPSALINLMKEFLSSDSVSPIMAKLLYQQNFCKDDKLAKNLKIFFGGDEVDPITRAISENSKKAQCNYVSTQQCEFDYSIDNSGSFLKFSLSLVSLILVALIL